MEGRFVEMNLNDFEWSCVNVYFDSDWSVDCVDLSWGCGYDG